MPPRSLPSLLYVLNVFLFDLATNLALFMIGVLIYLFWLATRWLVDYVVRRVSVHNFSKGSNDG